MFCEIGPSSQSNTFIPSHPYHFLLYHSDCGVKLEFTFVCNSSSFKRNNYNFFNFDLLLSNTVPLIEYVSGSTGAGHP